MFELRLSNEDRKVIEDHIRECVSASVINELYGGGTPGPEGWVLNGKIRGRLMQEVPLLVKSSLATLVKDSKFIKKLVSEIREFQL